MIGRTRVQLTLRNVNRRWFFLTMMHSAAWFSWIKGDDGSTRQNDVIVPSHFHLAGTIFPTRDKQRAGKGTCENTNKMLHALCFTHRHFCLRSRDFFPNLILNC